MPEMNKEIIENNFEIGLQHGSYISGFVSSFEHFNLSSEDIRKIIETKMGLEYQMEINRMKLETDERIANYANQLVVNNFNNDK